MTQQMIQILFKFIEGFNFINGFNFILVLIIVYIIFIIYFFLYILNPNKKNLKSLDTQHISIFKDKEFLIFKNNLFNLYYYTIIILFFYLFKNNILITNNLLFYINSFNLFIFILFFYFIILNNIFILKLFYYYNLITGYIQYLNEIEFGLKTTKFYYEKKNKQIIYSHIQEVLVLYLK